MRGARSATLWKVVATAAAAFAATTAIVASCLVRDVARRPAVAPAYVETVAGAPSCEVHSIGMSANDSTGGVSLTSAVMTTAAEIPDAEAPDADAPDAELFDAGAFPIRRLRDLPPGP